jgi:hypothetical protein
MAMKLNDVVPFGRSLDEYIKMFALEESDLNKKILGVADGPASFNAELTEKGGSVTSIDPIYIFQAQEIENKFYDVLDKIIDQVKATPDDWVWSFHGSPEELKENRIRATNKFVNDFKANRRSGRYVAGELPLLAFNDNSFDLALCSHFLFLYSEHLSLDFHLASIREMLRVAPEIRIFPLLTLMIEESPYIIPVKHELTKLGYSVEICQVEYELQRRGNKMMVIRKNGY